jgi:hypothetical protein
MTNHSVASILDQINASMIFIPSKYDQEICPSYFTKLEIGGNSNICMGVDHCSTSGVNFSLFPLCWMFNTDENNAQLEAKNITSITAD